MKFKNYEMVGPGGKVVYWYFPQQKSWVVQSLDAEGNQIGDADYVYSKAEAVKLAKWRAEIA